jgi:hypothetical protein
MMLAFRAGIKSQLLGNFWIITEDLLLVIVGRSIVSANAENLGHPVRGC